MRTTFSTLAIMASSLLVKEAFSAPAVRRDYYLDNNNVIVTEEVQLTRLADGSYAVEPPVAVSTVTIDGGATLVNQPVSAYTPAPNSGIPTPNELAIPSNTSTPTTSSCNVVANAGKRGLAYNDASLLQYFNGALEVSWCYNWASVTLPTSSKCEYTPMLWGLRPEDTSNWAKAVSTAIAHGSTHILSFNEPDHLAQANLSPVAAAAGYLAHMQPYASKAKLVAPAVTNAVGDNKGLDWLSKFILLCQSCTIDKVAVHWYHGGDIQAFKEYMAKAYTAGGNRPLWITEFQAPGTTGEEQAAFLTEAMAWMDNTCYIDRYSYFMLANGILVNGTALSSLGSIYATST